ncbi:hypothetical protein K466DRAFT_243881 [Polyporus arcularius HHB13444]|uniref:Uncharacterized protein n=1 Tax=Polyporus arcularius HHB13444 TaxID=1314778 RepID=A0A5C3P4E3_9APHY|nr:hypothetical protein K466DRAFT_243881 [Polyporus arcularius HHB13444]
MVLSNFLLPVSFRRHLERSAIAASRCLGPPRGRCNSLLYDDELYHRSSLGSGGEMKLVDVPASSTSANFELLSVFWTPPSGASCIAAGLAELSLSLQTSRMPGLGNAGVRPRGDPILLPRTPRWGHLWRMQPPWVHTSSTIRGRRRICLGDLRQRLRCGSQLRARWLRYTLSWPPDAFTRLTSLQSCTTRPDRSGAIIPE